MKLVLKIINKLKSCWRCHGMGLIELPNGETKDCPVCKGKGMV